MFKFFTNGLTAFLQENGFMFHDFSYIIVNDERVPGLVYIHPEIQMWGVKVYESGHWYATPSSIMLTTDNLYAYEDEAHVRKMLNETPFKQVIRKSKIQAVLDNGKA